MSDAMIRGARRAPSVTRLLLASTAFTGAFAAAMVAHPGGALAACAGIGTANVLCDAANQATAGTLSTSFAGTSVVNVNAGGKIDTGGAFAEVTAAGTLTFNHNDTTFGIKSFNGGVRLGNNFGAITYLGNADVTSTFNTGIAVGKSAGTGDVTVTNNATVTSQMGQGMFVSHAGAGNILINGSGNVVGTLNGINATQQGTTGGVTISGSGNATGPGNVGIAATIFNAANASDILINRSGSVSGAGGILASTQGTGKITITGFGTVTSTVIPGIQAMANGGNVSITGGGNVAASGAFGIAASATNGGDIQIAPAGTVTGGRGIVANTSFGLSNPATTTVTVSNNVTGTAGPGVQTLTDVGLATVNVTGGTINASGSMLGSIADGIQHQGGGSLLVNMTGGQIGTAASRTGAGGIVATISGTAGGVDITSTNVFSTSSAINATLSGATARNIAITTNGTTDASAGSGIVATIGATSATGNIAVTANGAVKGANGIVASNAGSGSTTVTVNAAITATGTGVDLSGGNGNIVTNNSTITGFVPFHTGGGTSTFINRGTATSTGTTGVLLSGTNNVFAMEGPGAALNGRAFGSGSDTFRFAGSGANSFDIDKLDVGWTVIDKTGTSNWTLNGTAMSTAAVTVREGTLTVNGNLATASGITVASGATLGGSGTLPSTTIAAGGALAPGNSIGVVNIAGNLVFGAGAIYRVEVSPIAADRTNVTGGATLTGATVQLSFSPGLYATRQYTILAATGGLGGTTFGGVTGANFNASLSYTATDVLLNISPALGLGTVTTRNQQNVADAINVAATNGTLPPALGGLFALSGNALGNALSGLSGEVHASTPGVLADESLYVRSAILGRLRQASYGGDMATMAALTLGGPQVAFAEEAQPLAYDKSPQTGSQIVTKAPPRQAEPDTVFWAQGFGAWGRFDGDGNAATVRRDLAGVVTGVDTRVGSRGRVGVAAGYTGSRNALDGLGASNVETAHIAGYGGWSFGAFNLRAGGAYAFHAIATDRTIAFPGFFDRTFANYDGHTGQVFGELGYGFAFGNLAVEPFAGAAWVRVKTDGAAERGGLAALNVAGTSFETGYTTLGIRAASIVPLAADMVLIPRATLAWQHAFDTVTPGNVLALQAAPVPFAISGVPIARDSLLAEAGVDLALGRNATIGVSYVGQIGNNVRDHAAKGKFTWKF